MAQIKKLLSHAVLEVAERLRVCHRNRRKHKIVKGETCLVVRSGRFESKNYCRECALPMLEKAQEDLGGLRGGFASTQPGSPP
jgi:hypothetical protein